MEQEVFISYSQRDSEIAERLCKAMEEVGISYFIDRDGISGGEHFINIVAKQILTCKVFLFLGSANAYKSKWTMKEVAFAFQEKDQESIIPVLVDDEPMPDGLRFLFTDINIISKTELILNKVIDALLGVLGKKNSTQLLITDFIEKWRRHPQDIVENTVPNMILQKFDSIEKFDFLNTLYYKECLSPFKIPFIMELPDTLWAEKIDWESLLILVTASFTHDFVPLVDYTLRISKPWKLNPQNDVRVQMFIEHLEGYHVDVGLEKMSENQVFHLMETILKEHLDSMIRWEFSEQKEEVESELKTALSKFENEICKINKAVFFERTKHYDRIDSFHEERSKVYLHELIGFIDITGKAITPIKWEDASDFSEGMACVADSESGYYGFIDKDGKVAIPLTWHGARPFKNGRAEVSDENGNWLLIDKSGNIISKLEP